MSRKPRNRPKRTYQTAISPAHISPTPRARRYEAMNETRRRGLVPPPEPPPSSARRRKPPSGAAAPTSGHHDKPQADEHPRRLIRRPPKRTSAVEAAGTGRPSPAPRTPPHLGSPTRRRGPSLSGSSPPPARSPKGQIEPGQPQPRTGSHTSHHCQIGRASCRERV